MQKVRKALIVVLAVIFVVSLSGVIRSQIGYRQGAADYSAAEELAGVPQEVHPDSQESKPQEPSQDTENVPAEPEDPYITALLETDLLALQEVNEDVLGWIQIPDMEISYPLVQGTDNDYYLDHSWQKKSSSVGAVYVDYRNSLDLSDFNTIIYGHNMKNDSMFGQLDLFHDEDFLKEHPYVYIVDESGCRKYQIFAAYDVSVSTAESYQLSFSGGEDRRAFIDTCLGLSYIDAGITPTADAPIITLSTCTGWGYSARWVVQAALIQEVVGGNES